MFYGRFGQGSWPTDPAPASFIDEAGVWIVKMVDVSGLQSGGAYVVSWNKCVDTINWRVCAERMR